MKQVGRFFLWILSTALPLLVGVLGVCVLIIDLFGPVRLPSGHGDEVLLAAASVVLLAYFAQNQRQASHDATHDRLLLKVEAVLERVEDRLDSVRQVPASDIRGLLESNVQGASEYLFRGGSGRWLRKFTMPALSKATDRDVRITIELLDPRDEDLCGAYARYRSKALPKGQLRDQEDPRLIQRDILGSIYAAAWYSARRRTQANVILLRSFSPLRYDVSSEGLMVTVAEMTEPGLFAARGTWLHKSIVDELNQAGHGHARVDLPSASEHHYPEPLTAVTAADVRAILSEATVRGRGTSSPLLESFAGAADVDWEAVATDHVRH